MKKKLEEKIFSLGRIYILPTKMGLYFLVITFILYLFSLSYGNPLAYTATFLFSSTIVVSTIFTNFNLSGIIVKANRAKSSFFDDEKKIITLSLFNSSNKTRFDLESIIGNNQRSHSYSVESKDSTQVDISLNNLERGKYLLKRVKLVSSFPFGLFYAWRYVEIEHCIYVFPQASGEKQPIQLLDTFGSDKEALDLNGNGDFYQHVPYVPGESWKRINWKVWAKSNDLLVKEYEGTSSSSYIFDSSTLSDLDSEKVLSQISKWIVVAKKNVSSFSMVLGSQTVEMGAGDNHCEKCLMLLSMIDRNEIEL